MKKNIICFMLLGFMLIGVSGCNKKKTNPNEPNPIVKKPSIKVLPSPINFYNNPIRVEKKLELRIENTGGAKLEIIKVSITNDTEDEDSVFYLNEAFEKVSLDSHEKTVIIINFTPLEKIEYTGSVIIESNDSDNSPLTITCSGRGSDEVYIPDSEFKKALLADININTNADKEISFAEAENVPTIKVSNLGIKDLTGIRAFKNLSTLHCQNNEITSLDLLGLNSLTELKCTSNELTSLNISGCAALEILHCNSNCLTELNVSASTLLKNLNCAHNQLTSLQVSNYTALEYLYCRSNQLTYLGVSGCPILRELNCAYNQLASLEVLGSTGLEYLSCAYNQLEALEVSACQGLKSIHCIENKLTFLDIEGCGKLDYFYISDQSIASGKKIIIKVWQDFNTVFPGSNFITYQADNVKVEWLKETAS